MNYIKTNAVCVCFDICLIYTVVSVYFAQYVNYIDKYVIKKILKYYNVIIITMYTQVMWDDVIGEPEGIRSPECAWRLSGHCFRLSRSCCYVFLSVLIAPLLALCFGFTFACLAFQVSHRPFSSFPNRSVLLTTYTQYDHCANIIAIVSQFVENVRRLLSPSTSDEGIFLWFILYLREGILKISFFLFFFQIYSNHIGVV